MKKALIVLACALSFASVAEAGKIVQCGTLGDALGGVDVYTLNSSTIAIRESTMAGTTVLWTVAAPSGTGYIAALEGGKPVTFFGQSTSRDPKLKSNVFGGGISNAVLITLGAAPAKGQRRSGLYSRGGYVFVISCGN